MTFGAPEWFFGFLLLPVLAGFFLRNEASRERLLKKLVAARLLANLAASTSAARRRWKFALAVLGLGCVVAALTEPRVGYDVVENHRRGLDLMIAVDTSKSMLSSDVQPDRLTRAKFAAQDLIDSLAGDRAGVIAFAGTSFVQAPLTIDYSAVEAALSDLDTNTIPRGGTNIASAIREAAAAFGTGESASRALVLFTDGEELEEDAVAAAKEVNGKFRIFTVGVGTTEGSLIPITGADGGTDFVKDDAGEFVKSHLDEGKLKAIAEATGGFYIHLENGPAMAKAIIEQGLEKMQQHEFATHESRPIERYEWPLAAGIVLLMASMLIRERRRVARSPARRRREAAALATTAALVMMMMMPARGWAENQGLQLYDQKDYKGAYDTFQNQLQRNPDSDGLEFDQGASAYKEGDYDKALNAFGRVLGSKDQGLRGEAEYNLGNTLVQRGALQEQKDEKVKEWTEALKHYDQALKVDPKNADAKYNEDVVRKMIDDLNKKEQQQQQQQKQDQQKQDQQKQNQQQQNQQAQNQQQQNQQQQNQQQQNQQAQSQPQQNQQQQNQQAQNQQQQDQQKQDQQQQNQQAQNQQPQDQQKQNQQGGEQGKQDQQQTAQQKQDEQNQASTNPTQNMPGSSPSPTPGPGVLKEQSQKDQQADAQAAARAATEQAQTGEMTPSQAQALVDSLRGEDEHVSLFDRKKNENEPVFKDW
jgi:Ca-activated chloride channel family protein